MHLSTSSYNRCVEQLPAASNAQQSAGLKDIYSMYVPRGPIRKYVTYFRAGGGMPLFVGHSEYYQFDHVIRHIIDRPSIETGYRDGMFGGGKGFDIAGMQISGVAETFERALSAFGFFNLGDKLTHGTPKDMRANGLECLGPEEMPIFAPEQFDDNRIIGSNFEPFTDNSFIGWVEGEKLVSGDKVWVPAQLALPFYLQAENECQIGYFTTGGLAAHISKEEAIYHGVLELMERDKVNIRWNCGRAPERIQLDKPVQNIELSRLLDIAESLPINFEFYLHDNDIEDVPVVTVISNSASFKQYAYYAGGGVGLDIEESMLYALTEYGQSEGTLRALLLAPDWELSNATRVLFDVEENIELEDIDMFFKVVSYYGYQSNFKKLDWYLKNGKNVNLSDLPTHFDNSIETRTNKLMGILNKNNIDPIMIDLSPPQMKQMRLYKAFSPQLTPPYVQNMPMLANPRYYDVPKKMGWSKDRLTYKDLIKAPQPYP